MKFYQYILPVIFGVSAMFSAEIASAQVGSLNITQLQAAGCSGGGTFVGILSVPGACSVDGVLPATTVTLSGPSQGGTFTSYDGYQIANYGNLVPGDYIYTLTAQSPCSGSAQFPFTIEEEGVYPNISITNNPTDCNDDEFVTVQNNSGVAIDLTEFGGASLGTLQAGQSQDFSHEELGIPFNGNYSFGAATSTCPTPVEYDGNYPDGLSTVTGTISTVNASNGMSNGSASTVGGGTFGPWTINWSTGESSTGINTGSIENLAPGDYTVEIIGGNGCSFNGEFVITDGSISAVEGLSSLFGSLSVFPNPASGNVITLKVDAFKIQRLLVSIMNAVGQEVVSPQLFEITQGTSNLSLDLKSALSNGMYYVKIIADNKVGTLPLMYSQD